MNALLNVGSGAVCIHIADPFRLGFFDEAVNQKMLKLIPDDTLFHENFERHYHDDNHVIFRVIQRERPFSTHSFNTRVLTDTGFTDPTHGQIRHFLSRMTEATGQKRKAENRKQRAVPSEKLTFEKDEAVLIEKTDENGKKKSIPFQESMGAQAKAIKNEIFRERGQQLVSGLVSYCLDDLGAHNYMSAFSKLPTGGSLYIGVFEEKKEEKKWKEINVPEICSKLDRLGNPDLKLFEDKKEKDLYHIATDTKVPTSTHKKSGVFKPAGVKLTSEQQANFKQELLSGLQRKMKMEPAASFHPLNPGASEEATGSRPIDVKFHKVKGDGTLVVEIRAENFNGVYFTDPAGPKAYHCICPETGPVKTELFSVKKWIERVMRNVEPHSKSVRHVSSQTDC